MIFYKVVHKDFSGRLVSSTTEGIYKVEYNIDKVTKPIIGKLFIFDSILNAKSYIHTIQISLNYFADNKYIYKCETLNPEPLTLMALPLNNISIKRFWTKEYELHPILWETSLGTYVCDSLTLLKRIE